MVRELSDLEVKALQYELLLKDILAAAEKLPPFPDVVWKVMSLIRKAATPNQIEEVIRYDQAITARVLRMSQSVYYGRRRRVSTLQDAILHLGNNRLVQVVLAASASRYFQGPISGYESNERNLWEHSVSTAVMSERISSRLKHRKGLTIFTASLLHDIGKTVLDLYAQIYFHTTLQQLTQGGREFIEAERRAMGIDHQELGEIIARRWRLPNEVVTAVGCHHCPEKAVTNRDIAAIVYASDRMVTLMGSGNEEMEPFDPEGDHVFKVLGIDTRMMQALQTQVSEAMDEIRLFLVAE
jgi:putative nucleotidyltransferase with HDIG domain